MICTIEKNECINPTYYRLTFREPEIAERSAPGQFLMIRISVKNFDPLLRRPLSIMNIADGGIVEILYKVVGRGTDILSQMKPGETFDVIGPLGNGFLPSSRAHTALLAGGGIGIPPLYFLARTLREMRGIDLKIFLGGKSREDVLLRNEFEKLDPFIVVTTDDGSAGIRGLVTEPVVKCLEKDDLNNPVIYGCGPDPMLHALAELAEKQRIPARLSLEEHMGCGLGACLGCVVKTTRGLERVCTDGPVFDAGDILKWNR